MSLLQAGLSSTGAAARASGIRTEGADPAVLLPRLLLGSTSGHPGIRAAAATCLQHLHSLPGLQPGMHSALRELGQALAGMGALVQADAGALTRVLARGVAGTAAADGAAAAATPVQKGSGRGKASKRKSAGSSASATPSADDDDDAT